MLGGFFDPKSERHVSEHCLPHWSQAGAVVFITFLTHDSIPRAVAEQRDRDKQEWIKQR
jgi:putative transposase